MNFFNPSSKNAKRAVQAWQILVGAAMHKKTYTYNELSRLMYQKEASSVMEKILGHVAYYCNEHDLPPLTTIVLGHGGIPGNDISMGLGDVDKQREEVYGYDWFNVYPPSAKKLKKAFNIKQVEAFV